MYDVPLQNPSNFATMGDASTGEYSDVHPADADEVLHQSPLLDLQQEYEDQLRKRSDESHGF